MASKASGGLQHDFHSTIRATFNEDLHLIQNHEELTLQTRKDIQTCQDYQHTFKDPFKYEITQLVEGSENLVVSVGDFSREVMQVEETHSHSHFYSHQHTSHPAAETGTFHHDEATRFYYFGYGSNLLKARLHLMNPSAVFMGVGRLANYELGFRQRDEARFANNWHGASATVVEREGSQVLGAVWSMENKERASLDIQEAAPYMYKAATVTVDLLDANGQTVKPLECLVYIMQSDVEGLPSPYYLDVILRGAHDINLPPDYFAKLRHWPHNKYFGPSSNYELVMQLLGDWETAQRGCVLQELRATYFATHHPDAHELHHLPS